MAKYTIYCLGFDSQQTASIEAILYLAASALTSSWQIIDSKNADIVLVNINNGEKYQFDVELNEYPDFRIIWVGKEKPSQFEENWFLAKKDQAPPSLQEFTHLLNQVEVCLQEAAKENQPIKEKTSGQLSEVISENEAEKVSYDQSIENNAQNSVFDISTSLTSRANKTERKLSRKNYFFGVLLQAKNDGLHRIIKFNKLPVLYVDPKTDSYFFTGTDEELVMYCTASVKSISNKTISKTKFEKIVNKELNALVPKDFDVLITLSILLASQGRLLEGQSAETFFRLHQYPDLKKLYLLEKYKSIADAMYQDESDLFTLSEKLQVPLSDVFDFFNVCYLFDLISVGNQKASNSGKQQENKGALSHFLKSFFKKQ